jgi:hypothetical protein
MKRREFLTSSLAASAFAGVAPFGMTASATELAPTNAREYYELRVYRLKTGANQSLLDTYLEKAALPALNRFGVKPIGVFTEIESKEAPAVYLLMPHPSIESVQSSAAKINADPEYQKAGTEYLQAPKDNPVFDRIDSWLLVAFAGMPKLELPAYCREKKARMFELRTYDSFSEVKALKKVEMFNSGEIATMREVGLAPIFYGQALVGRDLPHLTYMTSGENADVHKKHWDAFGKHAIWNKLKNDPQYADTVSKITKRFLAPTAYSQV